MPMLNSMLTVPRKEGTPRQPQTHWLLSLSFPWDKGLAHPMSLFVERLRYSRWASKGHSRGVFKIIWHIQIWCSSRASSARLSPSYLETPSFQEKAIINFKSSAKMADPTKEILLSPNRYIYQTICSMQYIYIKSLSQSIYIYIYL